MKISRNRANGKRYEGELVKTLRSLKIYARLGRSNEEVDVIIPSANIGIELKSTNRNDSWTFGCTNPRKTKDQYRRLLLSPMIIYYAIRFKGQGIAGLRLYSIPPEMCSLKKNEGLTLEEFVILVQKNTQEVSHAI